MKFALIYQVQLPKPWTDRGEYQLFQNILTQVSFAEEMGFESVWFMEHHFAPEQSHSSAPDMILAALSQRTSSMRLGLAVVLTPVHHPLQTAERLATLDLLSGGRVELGVGRSGHPYQLTPFGVMLEDSRGLWEESLAILPRAWTEEVFSYNGTYYNIPHRGSGGLYQVHRAIRSHWRRGTHVQLSARSGGSRRSDGVHPPVRQARHPGLSPEIAVSGPVRTKLFGAEACRVRGGEDRCRSHQTTPTS